MYSRTFSLEDISIRSGAHEDGRTVEAYAAVFDVPVPIKDQDGEYEEIIDRGAFKRAIDLARPAGGREAWRTGVLYNHGMNLHGSPSDAHSVPIGVCLDMKADSRGLLTVTRYHRAAESILEAIREGSINAYSFSGAFKRSTPLQAGKFRKDPVGRLTTVRRLESTLREYGPTPFPAYSQAEIVGMRAEQIAAHLSEMTTEERERLAELLTAELSTRTEDQPENDDAPNVDTSTQETVAGDPLPHSTRYHAHELYKLRSAELYKELGIKLPTGDENKGKCRMKLDEIIERQHAIRSELASLDNDPNTTEEDHADLRDSLANEWRNLDERAKPIIKRMQELKLIQEAGDEPVNRERTDSRWSGGTGPDVIVRQRRDPFADLDAVRNRLVDSSEIRGRALDAIEFESKRNELPREMAEVATRRAQENPGVAKHILLTGSDDYQDAFRAYLRDPENEGNPARSNRAVNLTAASGGYLLPYVLDPTIVLTNNASANPFRRVGNVKQTTSNAWQGVTSAGVTASWLSEASTAADASPTVGQIQIYPEKAAAWVLGSYEALDDTDFGTQLPKLLSDARDRLESDAFATGAGHGSTVPLGVLAALTSSQRVAPTNGSGSATGTGFPVNTDVYAVQAALPPRFRNSANVGWMANISYLNKIRSIDTYGGSSFWANFGSDTPEQLLGKPIYEASSLYGATGTGTGTGFAALVFGDWDQFIIVDRVGVSMIYEPMVKGTGATPSGQAGWYAFWRTSSGVSTSSAFRFLTVG